MPKISFDRQMAIISKNCYRGEHGKVEKQLSYVKFFKKGHVEVMTGNLGNLLVFAFTGSDEWRDWLDNLTFWKKESPEGMFKERYKIHKGHLEQWETIRPTIYKILNNRPKRTKVAITGHSLGASLATMCMKDLTDNTDLDLVCRAFAKCRIGSRRWAKHFEESVSNYKWFKYEEDTVCKLPPFWWGYKHEHGKVQLGKTTWREMLLSPFRRIFGNPMDHEPEDYIKAL